MNGKFYLSVTGAVFLAMASQASSVFHDNASNASLESGAAWQGGVAPTSDDLAVFDGASAGSDWSFATPLAWRGLKWLNTSGSDTTGPVVSSEEALTLGCDGLTVSSSGAASVCVGLNAPIVATSAQTWSLNGDGVVGALFVKPITVNGMLTLGGSFVGCYDLTGMAAVGGTGSVKVSGGKDTYLCLKSAAASVGVPLTVDSQKGGVVLLRDSEAVYDIKDAIVSAGASGGFVNNGRLLIGGSRSRSEAICPDRRQNIRISAGSKVDVTTEETTKDSAIVQVDGGSDVTVDGGSVVQNWMRIWQGRWVQAAGLTHVKYSAAIGLGVGAKMQECDVVGGTCRFYRARVGLANSDAVPARLSISGGTMESTATASNGAYGGLDIGLRAMGDESSGDGSSGSSLYGDYASGRVDLSGGVLRTTRIGFGSHLGEAFSLNYPDFASSAAFFMTGGELCLGGIGIGPNNGWNGNTNPDLAHDCQYKVVFSGGKVTTFENGVQQKANICLATTNVIFDIGKDRDYSVVAPMYGLGGFVKRGAGTMRFLCGNDYTGATVVAEGSLVSDGGIGSGAAFCLDAESISAVGEITSWSFGGDYDFTVDVPKALPATVQNPIVGRMGVHPAVVFGGAAALGLSGYSPATVESTGLTVGMVFSLDPDAECGTSDVWTENALLIGHVLNNNASGNNKRGWGVAVDSAGRVLAGSSYIANNVKIFDPYTLCNDKVNVKDGKPHVVIYRWSDVSNHMLWVDGRQVSGTEPEATKDWKTAFKTRTELGVQDIAGASVTPKFFKGRMARVQVWYSTAAGGATKSDAEVAALTRSMSAYYGVGTSDSSPVAAQVTDYPAATTEVVADSIAAAAGTKVEAWTPRTGNTTAYSLATAGNVMDEPTAPTLIDEGFNGHKAIRFDGVKDALAVGGAGAAFIKDANASNGTKKGFTISMVVRFNRQGSGSSSLEAFECLPFFGTSRSGNGDSYLWGLSLTGNERIKGGSVFSSAHTVNPSYYKAYRTAMPPTAWMNDGRVHVIVMTLPDYGEQRPMTLTVDGFRAESVPDWTNVADLGYGKSYMILGGTDHYHCYQTTYARLAYEVADIRFWPETQLTADEVRSLSEDLAVTYGAELDGYLTRGECGQRSSLVRIEAGATYGAETADGIVSLDAGQTLEGAGVMRGKLIAAAGSTLRLREDVAPTFNSILLRDGARIELTGPKSLPLTIANSLYVEPGDQIVVNCSAVASETDPVVVARCAKAGVFSPDNFVFEGTSAKWFKAIVSDDGRTLSVRKQTPGLMLIVR